MKVDEKTLVRGSQLYDILQDEFRVFQPTVAESKVALSMLCGAFLSGIANSDSDAVVLIAQFGEEVAHWYEQTKRINKSRQNEDREVIKLDS